MKYIIFIKPDEIETVRIFDEIESHSEVAREVLDRKPGLKIKSAGKLNFTEDLKGFYCISGSVILNIKGYTNQSREDEELIKKFFKIRL